MLRWPKVLTYAVLAFACWGSYGPTLHEGQIAMSQSRWRPFVCIGVAYFLVAVVVPSILSRRQSEPTPWTMSGVLWSLFGGALGCLGALGIIVAFDRGGSPYYVMPLVFGGAPVVNTLVTYFAHGDHRPTIMFYMGIVMVALGAAGVLVFKPVPKIIAGHTATKEPVSETTSGATENQLASKSHIPMGAIVAIMATALCWGSYGPALHKGQARMGGNRLKTFMCVGIAYFFVAIIIPLFILAAASDLGGWSVRGIFWSTLAGALGAIGALGVILAFNAGGRPSFVMPIVFGGAPVVNTAVTSVLNYWRHGEVGDVRQTFLLSLGLVILGAVTVLIFAPRATPSAQPANAG